MESFGKLLLILGALCYLHQGDAQLCTTAEESSLVTCVNPFTATNDAALRAIAGQANCPVSSTIDCSSWSTAVTCINDATISNICRTQIPTQFNLIQASFSTDCTVVILAGYCPSAPTLNIGSPSSRPVACISGIVAALVFFLLLFI